MNNTSEVEKDALKLLLSYTAIYEPDQGVTQQHLPEYVLQSQSFEMPKNSMFHAQISLGSAIQAR